MSAEHDAIIERTRQWVERAVIGLGLCPFARVPFEQALVDFVVSDARTLDALAEDLDAQLRRLDAIDPWECETVLLIHPYVLGDFLDFNDFLDVADALLAELDLVDDIQIASFHPHYQFGDAEPDAIENYTNRSPHPTLHLLRNASVDRAVSSVADPTQIYRTNIETLRRIGERGWRELWDER